MPKNTYFIKENIPKIEEVREIENEVPSYEEFLKNYKQGQVNYSDLTYEDINSNKGYGPCRWNNPRCSCQYNERWVDLRTNCPACGNGRVSAHTCGGQLEISSKARVQCKGCGTVSRVEYFGFSCSYHSGEYRQASARSVQDALFVAYGNGEIPHDIFMSILQELRENRW